ncbi:MAG: YicC family protein [Flavobacteriales bacterium]|jgi:uncharacterized protein (TIGR00255 family)|nr:YicC family protein [Flavobacteriales bacterium]
MTGYGKAESNIGTKKVTVEIKSVNSKTFDCNLRTPSFFREKEMEIRSLLAKELIRGKIEVNVNYTTLETEQKHFVNKGLVQRYYQDLLEVVNEAELSNKDKIDFLSIVMKMPEVMRSEKEALSKENAQSYIELVSSAIEQFLAFRKEEGVSLQNDIFSNIHKITELLTKVEPYEQERIEIVKERIKKNLEALVDKPNIDENRYHQELIYYIEKLDISEEKVRLKAHCEHFLKTANGEELGKGKKLGFITQEIGREINTLGSKANHAEMQKIVVLMKDALEKIKEQILNVL